MGPDRPPDKARQENAPHSQSLAGEGFVFVGEWELRIPPPQCSTRPNIRCLFGADRGGKGATQSGRCSADAVMWHAVQHGDLYVLCGTQCEWYVDVLPCRRCHVAWMWHNASPFMWPRRWLAKTHRRPPPSAVSRGKQFTASLASWKFTHIDTALHGCNMGQASVIPRGVLVASPV